MQNSFSIETDYAYYFFTHLVQRRKVFELVERVYNFHVDSSSLQRKINRCPYHSILSSKCDNCANGVKSMVDTVTIRAAPIERVRKFRSIDYCTSSHQSEFEEEPSLNGVDSSESMNKMELLCAKLKSPFSTNPMLTPRSLTNVSREAQEFSQYTIGSGISTPSESSRPLNSRFFNVNPFKVKSHSRMISPIEQIDVMSSLEINNQELNPFHPMSYLATSSLPRKLSSTNMENSKSVSTELNQLNGIKILVSTDTSCQCAPSKSMTSIVDRVVSLDINSTWEIMFTFDAYGIQKSFLTDIEKVSF